ncbi:MAG: glycosyltransferase, partial [Thermodesulfobacteriota bacterium]
MNIAIIVHLFPNLSETFILNQITGLLDMGHHVEIFAGFNPKQEKIHPDVLKYNLLQRTHYLPEGKIKLILNSLYLLLTNFHKSPINLLRTLNIFRYRKVGLVLRLLQTLIHLMEMDFDIIHCHYGTNGVVGAYLKEMGIKGKIVTSFHGYDMSSFVVSSGYEVYRHLFLFGDLFLPISDYWEKKLIELGCDEKRIVVHRMGIDVNKFKYCEKKIKSGEPINILSVGRLVEKKGYEYAFKSIARIAKTRKYIEYLVAGEGSLKETLACLISELGIEKNSKLLGELSRDEIIKLYEEAHIFILASVTANDNDQEGIPVVLMEAQAVGLPIVSTHHTGIPEVVSDGKSGFLVPERDEDALVEKLQYLIEHPELWPEMGRY